MKKYCEFGPVVQEEVQFKEFSIFSSGGHFGQWSGTICAILEEGFVGNIIISYFDRWFRK